MTTEMENLLTLAKGIEVKLGELEKARTEDADSKAKLEAKLTALAEEQTNIAQKFLTLSQKAIAKGGDEKQYVTLGASVTGSQQYQDLMAGKIRKLVLSEAEAPSFVGTPAGAVQPDYQGLRGEPQLPNTVANAFTRVNTTSDSISFLREKSFTNSAAEVAAGSVKPQSDIKFETDSATVKTIAHFIRVTKQLAADAPALAAYINARMSYGLDRRIEHQLISGDGTGDNLKGLLVTGTYTVHGFNKTNMPADATVLDLIRRSGAVIAKLGYTPSTVFLNPMDVDTLRGMKDKNGNYLMGSPLQAAAELRPWGLHMVVSPEIPEGKYLVGDTAMGATIYDRQAPVIEMFEQDSDNVQRNLYTVRVECRMAFAVENAACFVGGALAIAES